MNGKPRAQRKIDSASGLTQQYILLRTDNTSGQTCLGGYIFWMVAELKEKDEAVHATPELEDDNDDGEEDGVVENPTSGGACYHTHIFREGSVQSILQSSRCQKEEKEKEAKEEESRTIRPSSCRTVKAFPGRHIP